MFDGKRIKAAAAQAGMTLSDLATHLEITRSTLYAYVAGTIQPPKSRVRQIALVTGTDEAFFTGEGALAREAEDARTRIRLAEAMLVGSDPESAAAILCEVAGDTDPAEQASLSLRLAAAFVASGQYTAAIPWCYRAKEGFATVKDQHGMGRAAQTIGFIFAHIGPLSSAERAFREAEKLLDLEHKWKARVAFAALDERRGFLTESLDRTTELLLTETASQPRLYALCARADALARLERWDDAEVVESEALEVAIRLGARDQVGERLIARCLIAIYRREPELDAWLARAEGFFMGSPDRGRRAHFLSVLALAQLQSSNLESADATAKQALNLAIEGQYRRAEITSTLRLAQIAALCGQMDEAKARADQAEALSRAHEYATEGWHASALSQYALASLKGRPLDTSSLHCPVPSAVALSDAARTQLPSSIPAYLKGHGFTFIPGIQLS